MDLKPLARGRKEERGRGAASGCVPTRPVLPPSTTFIHNSGGPGGHAEDDGGWDEGERRRMSRPTPTSKKDGEERERESAPFLLNNYATLLAIKERAVRDVGATRTAEWHPSRS